MSFVEMIKLSRHKPVTEEFLEITEDDKKNASPLMRSIIDSDMIGLDNHLNKENVRKTDSKGRTALMYALIYNNCEAVRTLIPYEGEVRDTNGNSAYEYALSRLRPGKEITEMLFVHSQQPKERTISVSY